MFDWVIPFLVVLTVLVFVHELGHSFGGLYVLSFAAQFPDQVAGLVLLDSTAPAPGPDQTADMETAPVVARVAAVLPAAAAFQSESGVIRKVWMCSGLFTNSAKRLSSSRTCSNAGCATSRRRVRSLWTMGGFSGRMAITGSLNLRA